MYMDKAIDSRRAYIVLTVLVIATWLRRVRAFDCKPFYFGNACQFASIPLEPLGNASFPSWLVDGDPITCGNTSVDTYFRFRVLNVTGVLEFEYIFKERLPEVYPVIYLQHSAGNATVPCHVKQTKPSRFGTRGVVFQCTCFHTILSISVLGPAVQELCELRLSPGPNFAPQGQMTMMDRDKGSQSLQAVTLPIDGDRKSCMVLPEGRNIVWTHTLANVMDLSMVLLHGSGNETTWRPANGQIQVTSKDHTGTWRLSYDVKSHVPVISIVKLVPNARDVILLQRGGWPTLCELEIHGVNPGSKIETSPAPGCQHGWYGRECDKACSASCGYSLPTCHPLSGDCLVCPPGLYGSKCELTCSDNCRGGRCIPDTGLCPSGCEGNYIPPQCTDCPNGTFGENCAQICSLNCANGTCDVITGECRSCQKGWTGKTCSMSDTVSTPLGCTDGTFGENCAQICSPNCEDGICDRITGECRSCQEGWMGKMCSTNKTERLNKIQLSKSVTCEKGTFGENCSKICSPNCSNGTCDAMTGECRSCQKGWMGKTCSMNEKDSTGYLSERKSLKQSTLLIAMMILILFCILVIVALLMVCRQG